MANEGDALIAGSISQCPSYTEGKGKAAVQAQIKQQLETFVKNKVDFIIAEVCMFLSLNEANNTDAACYQCYFAELLSRW